jgi:hypothetical protein
MRTDPRDLDPLERMAQRFDHLVLRPEKRGVPTFRCPLCRSVARNDAGMEPMCTGPHPSLDEHEPTVMVRVHL